MNSLGKVLAQKVFTMWVTVLAVVLVTSVAEYSYAYIPSSKTILSRAARGHGKGAYIIEQDVTLKVEGDPIVLRERWTILNAESMRLSVSRKGSDDFKLDIVYRNGKRSFFDPQGSVKAINISSEFIEPYFFYRTSASLQSSMVKAKILPSDFGQQPRRLLPPDPKADSKNLRSIPEPYVRLSRTGGAVNYALGRAGENTQVSPGAWIEQDAFVIRRLKFPTAAEVEADQYGEFANKLKFPRERTIRWGNYSATARISSIKAATDAEATVALNLGAGGEQSASKVPEIAGLKEFYSRFR